MLLIVRLVIVHLGSELGHRFAFIHFGLFVYYIIRSPIFNGTEKMGFQSYFNFFRLPFFF